jgi:hypothetical protein
VLSNGKLQFSGLDRINDPGPLSFVLFLGQQALIPKFLELSQLDGGITPGLCT